MDIIPLDKMKSLAKEASRDKNYFKPAEKPENIRREDYSTFCSKCRNCVDVCPSRANVFLERNNKKYTLHQDALCNECGNCSHFCILGHISYKEKFTVFRTEEDLFNSTNDGFYQEGDNSTIRWKNLIYIGREEDLIGIPEEIRDLINCVKIRR